MKKMKKIKMKKITTILLAGTAALFMTACGGGSSSSDVAVVAPIPTPNVAPTANAGADKTVDTNETVSITGSGTDTDGTIVSYRWTEGSTVLSNSATFDYSPTTIGTYTLTLTVTDDDGATDSDTMNIDVPYTHISDLEFKTLSLTEYWHVLDNYLYSTMEFDNNYIYNSADGTPILVDELSTTIMTSGCQVAPVDLGTTYMCLRVFDSGAWAGYAIDIDSNGSITGNFEYSDTGDVEEIVAGLLDRDLADAWVTGTASSNVATTTTKASNAIDNQAKLSEYDSIIPQPLKQQSNTNSEAAQKIDEMFNLLMLKDEI